MRAYVIGLVALVAASGCTERSDAFAPLGTADLELTPATVAADGVAASIVTVHVRDVSNQAIAGVPVAFKATGVDVNVVVSGPTDAQGVCTATVTGTAVGTAIITATATFQSGHPVDVPGSAILTFSTSVPSVANSALSANPTTVIADGHSVTALLLTLRDTLGAVVPNVRVEWSSTGTGNSFSAGSGVTDANGRLMTNLSRRAREA